MTPIDPQELASRYVAIWNKPDAELRRKAIQNLWSDDGAHILQPPQEIRQVATRLGFPFTILQARGYDALEAQVTRAYEAFVAPGEFTFNPREHADRLGKVVKFSWEMVPLAAAKWRVSTWRSSSSTRTAVSRPIVSSSNNSGGRVPVGTAHR